ncbi:MAG: DUF1834 family protein [Sphingomonadales bacterium]|nr:MAG: DUF1834 family protein [Sphingomonadales bacterium]
MIDQTELSILAHLQAASDSDMLGYRYRQLETYPVDWDEYLKDKGQLASPAAWVTFAGIDRFEGGKSNLRAICSFGVVVAARNERSETATRHGHRKQGGALAEVGSYQMMLDAAGLLVGEDFGLDIDKLELVAAGPVPAGNLAFLRKASMFALHFQTAVAVEKLQLGTGQLTDFAKFHANWDIAPHGNVDADPEAAGIQIPADATADANDHVEIQP